MQQLWSELEVGNFRWITITGENIPKWGFLFIWSLSVHHLAATLPKQSIPAAWAEEKQNFMCVKFKEQIHSKQKTKKTKRQPAASLQAKTQQQFNAVEVKLSLHHTKYFTVLEEFLLTYSHSSNVKAWLITLMMHFKGELLYFQPVCVCVCDWSNIVGGWYSRQLRKKLEGDSRVQMRTVRNLALKSRRLLFKL